MKMKNDLKILIAHGLITLSLVFLFIFLITSNFPGHFYIFIFLFVLYYIITFLFNLLFFQIKRFTNNYGLFTAKMLLVSILFSVLIFYALPYLYYAVIIMVILSSIVIITLLAIMNFIAFILSR